MKIRLIEYRPPKIAQLFVLLAALLHWAAPLNKLTMYSNQVVGVVLGIAGFGIMMWSWWLFKKFDIAISPKEKTGYLVTTGIYRISRHPMYLGMIVMMFALAVFFGSFPFYLAAVGYFVIINNVFCPYEENKLTETFGDRYLAYKTHVRRWL